MAVMSINIKGDLIDLIHNVNELSNECRSVYTFDIKTTSGNVVSMDTTFLGGNYPYDKIEICQSGVWSEVTVFPVDITADAEGKAQGRITIGNATTSMTTVTDDEGNEVPGELEYVCNDTELTITDSLNSASEKYFFSRCYEAPRC